MRKINLFIILLFSVTLSAQSALANKKMHSESCKAVAKACKDAGYEKWGNKGKKGERGGDKDNGKHKNFWKDCMGPLVRGDKVEGVKVEADTVKACRMDKINAMKAELKELEGVK